MGKQKKGKRRSERIVLNDQTYSMLIRAQSELVERINQESISYEIKIEGLQHACGHLAGTQTQHSETLTAILIKLDTLEKEQERMSKIIKPKGFWNWLRRKYYDKSRHYFKEN